MKESEAWEIVVRDHEPIKDTRVQTLLYWLKPLISQRTEIVVNLLWTLHLKCQKQSALLVKLNKEKGEKDNIITFSVTKE